MPYTVYTRVLRAFIDSTLDAIETEYTTYYAVVVFVAEVLLVFDFKLVGPIIFSFLLASSNKYLDNIVHWLQHLSLKFHHLTKPESPRLEITLLQITSGVNMFPLTHGLVAPNHKTLFPLQMTSVDFTDM